MKEQQTYPIEWLDNVAYCRGYKVGHIEQDEDGITACGLFGQYLRHPEFNTVESYYTTELAMAAVENAFRSFIRDVTIKK